MAGGGGPTAVLNDARRILVLAPHPDDEIVACGIAAMRARAAGAGVFVLYLTTGVPEPGALWPWRRATHRVWVQRRRREAQAAAALLGLEPIGFLDIPSRCLRHHLDQAAVAVADAIAANAPDALWVPAFEGAHQDHDAANALAAGLAHRLSVWEFAAYNFAGGRVHSNRFANRRGGEFEIVASELEVRLKREALACYASERGNLRHIAITREAGRPLSAHDYGSPPHAGRLFRERFHWVPFRHPRVDFAPSSDIYRDIGCWASARLPRRPAALGERPGREPGQTDRKFAHALDEAQR